jgi:hypothetical protein
MTAHGYILKGNSKTAQPDYIPSLIGIDTGTFTPNKTNPYFERIDITDRTITSLAASRWNVFDSLVTGTETALDPILEVRGPRLSYYIPKSELFEIAAFNHDDDTIDMLNALSI